MRKRIVITAIVLFVITLFIMILAVLLTTKKDFSVTTIKKSYCYINKCNEKQEFIVDLFIDNQKSYMLESQNISNCYLENKDQSEMLEIKLIDIKNTSNILTINNQDYHLYKFEFEIPLIVEKECKFNFKDAFIVMNYPKKEIIIEIGSFYYLKLENYREINDYLSLNKIKPIVNYRGNNKTLAGLNIAFNNNSNDDIEIFNLEILASNCCLSFGEKIEVDSVISSKDSLSEMLGYQYDYEKVIDDEVLELSIKMDSEKEYIFPIKYFNDYIVDVAGVLVEYRYQGADYKCYYDEILFFQSTSYNLTLNDLDILTYENN